MILSRRTLLIGGAGTLLAGCDKLNSSPGFRSALRSGEGLTMRAQRLISSRTAMAREFGAADMSPVFRSNGTGNPDTPDYNRLAAGAFAEWRLGVDGLVRRRFVERHQEPEDRRQRTLRLTPRGHAILRVVDRSRADQFLNAVRPLPTAERAIVAMGVAALATHAINRRGRLIKAPRD